ncbi:hypothetical protein [Nocardioides panacisoli]|uniref:hypothetical protein n=1 Tax=Nocardioides panacisoli TaxID=627624 RepID=UPI0031D77804
MAAGAVLGLAAAELSARVSGSRLALASGAGLVTAAAIYPLARRERGEGVALEGAVLAGAGLLTALAGTRPTDPRIRRTLAGAWAAHALFDLLRGPTSDSRLPGWYPAVCAGYDVAYAARTAL